MTESQRARAFVLALLLALEPALGSDPPRPNELRLAVVIVVDGLGEEELRQRAPLFDQGLARLLRESTVYTETRFAHLATETGPGHAAIATGQPPSHTGIIANAWYAPRATGQLRMVHCTDQWIDNKLEVGPASLAVPTLGDRLAMRGAARVVTLSGKNRATIMLAGRDRRHVAYWFDSTPFQFVTSPVYHASSERSADFHRAIRQFNDRKVAESIVATEPRAGWLPLDRTLDPKHPGLHGVRTDKELLPYQDPEFGLGFPHRLRTATGLIDGDAVAHTPVIDRLISALTRQLISDDVLRLGRNHDPDLLLVSFSAHDLVAHDFGIESGEAVDTLRRLDREIGDLLDLLVAKVGRDHLVVVLTADHGFQPIPELSGGIRCFVQPAKPKALPGAVERLNSALGLRLGIPPDSEVVAQLLGWNVYYNHEALAAGTIRREREGRPIGVADVDAALPDAVRFALPKETRSTLLARRIDDWPSGPLGDTARNTFFLISPDPGRSSGHCGPHDPDAHVPLLFWGSRFAPRTSSAPTTPYDVAPTLAALLGVDLGPTLGRDLSGRAGPPDAPVPGRR